MKYATVLSVKTVAPTMGALPVVMLLWQREENEFHLLCRSSMVKRKASGEVRDLADTRPRLGT